MGGRMAGVLVAIVWGAMLAPASGQSLGEVARQEAARREKIKTSGKVLTNADLPASAVLQPATTEAAAGGPDASTKETAAGSAADDGATPAATGDAATTGSSDTAGAPKVAAAPRDDEEGWRQRAAAVNKALGEARTQVRQLRALSDRLSLEMQAADPAVVTRATRERQDVKSQLAAAEAREAEAAATRLAFEQDARRAGVPPAWIQ